jgi:hypothetical protein
MRALIKNVIEKALAEAKSLEVPIYTFALYYDHESPAISVCIDTEVNSMVTVRRINTYNRKYFIPAVKSGDMENAALWQSNIGRSLSLGDFHMVNVARTELPEGFTPSDGLFLAMAQCLLDAEIVIAAQAANIEYLLVCCSGNTNEVELCWSLA